MLQLDSSFVISDLEQEVPPRFPKFEEDFSVKVKIKEGLYENTYLLCPVDYGGRVFGLNIHRTYMVTVSQKEDGQLVVEARRYMKSNCIYAVADQVYYNR